jgi:hypothetical protein
MQQIQGEWYQQGFWPLVGAALILVIPNAVALWGIFIETHRQTKSQLLIKQVDLISQQLAEFYDPLFAMLKINEECFSKLGPKTFPKDAIHLESAGEVWNQIKQKVIIPNNHEMANILRTRSHLIASFDSISSYLPLNSHIAMYEIFADSPNEIYKDFTFPVGVTDHVVAIREKLLKQLNDAKGGNL